MRIVIDADACPKAVKNICLELAKKYHPDLHMTKSVYERSVIEKKFLSIKEAYEFLRG